MSQADGDNRNRYALLAFLVQSVQEAAEAVHVMRHQGAPSRFASWEFIGALGELRGVVGVHVARIATQYGVDVEDDLGRILPAGETDEDS